MKESELQRSVEELARFLGWRVAHFRPAMVGGEWRTAVSADGKGFPDLVLVKSRTLFRELKVGRGRMSKDQDDWIAALEAAGADVAIWTDMDWLEGRILSELKGDG